MHYLVKRGLVVLTGIAMMVGGLSVPAHAVSLLVAPTNATALHNTIKGKPGLAKQTTSAKVAGSAALLTTNYFYNVGRQTLTAPDFSTGMTANFRIQKPYVDSLSYHSLAEIALQSADSQQIVEAGWNVDPGLYGDSNPHIFVGSWVNNVFKGYNASNVNWVDYASNAQNAGASILADVDLSKTMNIQVSAGNWWVSYNGAWLGYFKGSQWTAAGVTFDKGYVHQWFGEVASQETTPCADMGNGYQGTYTLANPARIGTMGIFGTTTPTSVSPVAQPSGASPYYIPSASSVTTFKYGGPGWNSAGTALGTKDAC